jgi:hypothetical protein
LKVLKRLVHFLLLGSFLFGLQLWLREREQPGLEPIWIAEDEARALEDAWTQKYGKPPPPEELQRMLQNRVDEEILFREALRAGLHLQDPVVKRRLDMNMEFVDIDGSLSPEERVQRAYELGMHETDLVVRRRLVQRVQIHLRDKALVAEPSPQEIQEFIAAHREEFEVPRYVGFSHVYFSEEFGNPKERAEEALERIQRERMPLDRAQELGDPFGLPLDFPPLSMSGIARRFGDVFATEVMVAPEHAWSGPLSSSLGEHLIWVEEVHEAELVEDDMLRDRARRMLIDEAKDATFEKIMAVLRGRYEVLIQASSGEPIHLSAFAAATDAAETVPATTVPASTVEAAK